MKRFIIAVLTACMALPVLAQEDALKDLPGYIDFGELTSAYGEPKVNITIGGTLLNFVGAMASKEEPEAAQVFSQLKGVRVSTYATGGVAIARSTRGGTMLGPGPNKMREGRSRSLYCVWSI